MSSVPFGPGTILIGTPGTDFACEVLGGAVTHSYEEVGEARTALCGTAKSAPRTRIDGLSFDVENDLTAAGLYKYLHDNDLSDVPFVYTPNTAAGAKWEGTVTLTLPDEIGADQFGSPIASSVAWTGVGPFTFTPATAATTAEPDA